MRDLFGLAASRAAPAPHQTGPCQSSVGRLHRPTATDRARRQRPHPAWLRHRNCSPTTSRLLARLAAPRPALCKSSGSPQAARARELAEIRPAARGTARRGRPRPAHTAGRHQGRVSSLRQPDLDLDPRGDRGAAGHHRGVGRPADRPGREPAGHEPPAGRRAVSVHLAPVALDEVVAGHCCTGPHADVGVDVPDDLPLALADPGLLERVVANLLDNAYRHARPTRPVTRPRRAPTTDEPRPAAGRRPRARRLAAADRDACSPRSSGSDDRGTSTRPRARAWPSPAASPRP